jgi:hypothetical protein
MPKGGYTSAGKAVVSGGVKGTKGTAAGSAAAKGSATSKGGGAQRQTAGKVVSGQGTGAQTGH